jgi:hypothetical protein
MGIFYHGTESQQPEGPSGNADDIEDGVVLDFGYTKSYSRVLGTVAAFAVVIAVASSVLVTLLMESCHLSYH